MPTKEIGSASIDKATFMGWPWQPDKLLPMAEVLETLKAGGETDRAMATIREYEEQIAGYELMWRYPISDGYHAGTFVVPMREGFLSVPYDEMDREEGELLLLHDARLLSADDLAILREDFKDYADALYSALGEALNIMNQ